MISRKNVLDGVGSIGRFSDEDLSILDSLTFTFCHACRATCFEMLRSIPMKFEGDKPIKHTFDPRATMLN